MKNIKKLFAVLCFLVIAISFTACKKNDNNDVKPPDCRITTQTYTGYVYRILYNNEGKISKQVYNNGDTVTYNYSGNTITLIRITSGAFISKKIVTLNAAGLATNVYDSTSTSWGNSKFEYNGEELSRFIGTYAGGTQPDTTVYTWLDHNLVSKIYGTDTTRYSYYADKASQKGDYFWLQRISNGYETIRIKNLLKTFINPSNNITYTYEFRADGNISSLSSNGAAAPFVKYDYECN